ncbi:MAG: hypothetical protein CVT80_15620 [Alphaproteobacteria bacterium HGW-Alphaproteobacteria-2]|nr:MAG: hypothetical protein CVT80_15620 [Alphaproteobacteria bacterium HGW-Alphaproteobacteria-2]
MLCSAPPLIPKVSVSNSLFRAVWPSALNSRFDSVCAAPKVSVTVSPTVRLSSFDGLHCAEAVSTLHTPSPAPPPAATSPADELSK